MLSMSLTGLTDGSGTPTVGFGIASITGGTPSSTSKVYISGYVVSDVNRVAGLLTVVAGYDPDQGWLGLVQALGAAGAGPDASAGITIIYYVFN
jgi:hypothetical protein